MKYKRAKIKQNNEEYFQYKPKFSKKIKNKKISKGSPFQKLSELRFR